MGEMFNKGFAEKLDIEKIQVTVNNTQTALNQLNNGLGISYGFLKSTIGVPQKDSLVLATELDDKELQMLAIAQNDNFDYNQRNEVALLNTAHKLQALDLKRYKMAYIPTAAAFFSTSATDRETPNSVLKTPGFFIPPVWWASVSMPLFLMDSSANAKWSRPSLV